MADAVWTPVPARDAATVMLVRDSPHMRARSRPLEVCMLRRHLDSDFVGGAFVFPGGKVDEEDRSSEAADLCTGRTDVQASHLLGVPSGGLAFWVAALRECYEEAGVLLAYHDAQFPGAQLVHASDPAVRARLAEHRRLVNAGRRSFLDACRSEGLRLAVDRVHYFSHWITPELAPKRFDTRFFVAALPPDQTPEHDEHETTATVWVEPHDALDRARGGEFELIFPTMKNLQAIARFRTSAELLGAAAAVESVPAELPRVVGDERGMRILLPGDSGYEEAFTGAGPSGGSPPRR
jgi:8-oxo-dGTP pyrophosphatase MutT (NUDIX family)